ncbi:MAG TPA: ABC transporter substrate-binding protein [Egibacteraceae bacterium]|nr:ABC transporter substrate-binding protein [Egibacteraceae bacterium]
MSAVPRVASLVPAGTDIVAALGLGAALVGVSHACDHPVADGLPVLTASALGDVASPAGEVDRRVRAAVSAGEPLYRVDVALLGSLAPDVVLAQDVCDVCALPGADAAGALPAGAELVLLRGASLAGLEADLMMVGAAMGVSDRAERQIAAIASAHRHVRRRVAGRPHPRVVALEWGDPPFLAGHWVPELVEVAGGRHLLTGAGEASRRSSWDEVAAVDPDAIVFLPCGYGVERAVAEASQLAGLPEVTQLRAVRAGRFWAVEAARLFSRLSPAVVTAAPVLASLLHPDRFPAVSARWAVAIAAA